MRALLRRVLRHARALWRRPWSPLEADVLRAYLSGFGRGSEPGEGGPGGDGPGPDVSAERP